MNKFKFQDFFDDKEYNQKNQKAKNQKESEFYNFFDDNKTHKAKKLNSFKLKTNKILQTKSKKLINKIKDIFFSILKFSAIVAVFTITLQLAMNYQSVYQVIKYKFADKDEWKKVEEKYEKIADKDEDNENIKIDKKISKEDKIEEEKMKTKRREKIIAKEKEKRDMQKKIREKILERSKIKKILSEEITEENNIKKEKKKIALEIQNKEKENEIKEIQKKISKKSNKLPMPKIDNSKKNKMPQFNNFISPPDTRIIIPKIGKNVPIRFTSDKNLKNKNFDQLEKDILKDLQSGVVHYPGTAMPGNKGNVFITGHSSYYPWDNGKYKNVFALLPSLEKGDEFTIFYNQKKYRYKIFQKDVVNPDNVNVMDQGSERIATLMTCYPVGTNLKRMIIRAHLI